MISSPAHPNTGLSPRRLRPLLIALGLGASCAISFLLTAALLDYRARQDEALYRQRFAIQTRIAAPGVDQASYNLNFIAGSEGPKALEEGWIPQKGLGALSAAETARLSFVIDRPDFPVQEGVVVLKLKPYLIPGVVERQTIAARINGGPEQMFTLDQPEATIAVPFPGTALDDDRNVTVEFRFPTAKSPLELGVSADPTKVSVRLLSLAAKLAPFSR